MEMYTEYVVPLILLACLVTGYVIKQWVSDVDNKFIPTIVCVLGAALNVVNSGLSLEAIIYGAFTGLVSTGMHELFKSYINGGSE